MKSPINTNDTVVTCGHSGNGEGFLVYGKLMGIYDCTITSEAVTGGRAKLRFYFRGDYFDIIVRVESVRTADQDCRTCKQRLSKMLSRCNGKYVPVAQRQK